MLSAPHRTKATRGGLGSLNRPWVWYARKIKLPVFTPSAGSPWVIRPVKGSYRAHAYTFRSLPILSSNKTKPHGSGFLVGDEVPPCVSHRHSNPLLGTLPLDVVTRSPFVMYLGFVVQTAVASHHRALSKYGYDDPHFHPLYQGPRAFLQWADLTSRATPHLKILRAPPGVPLKLMI